MEELKKMDLTNPIRAIQFKMLDLERLEMHKVLTEKKLLEAFDAKTKHIKVDDSILDPLERNIKFNQEQFKVFTELVK